MNIKCLKSCSTFAFNVKKHGLWGWCKHQRNLHRCLEHLPDNWYYGYAALSEAELLRRFDGDRLECLKTLLRKHKGEVIWLDSDRRHPSPIIANIAVFHPELYTNRDSDGDQQSVSEAVRVRLNEFQAGKKSPRLEARFMEWVKGVPNSIFRPIWGTHWQRSCVIYQTLPGLVWEMMDNYSLLDIYTFFCCAPLLVLKKKTKRRSGETKRESGDGSRRR